MAGATMQWVRDGLQIIKDASESESLAEQCSDDLKVFLVPAFTGLGAPYWDTEARAAIYGMTRDTGKKEIVTAALMSVVYQTKDLVNAINSDGGKLESLRVDGGMVKNNYVLQKMADLLDCEVYRPRITETTALGAAYMAGLHIGVFESLESLSSKWQLERTFSPEKNEQWREQQYKGWEKAIERTRS
jgi:glycerol kinase